MAEDSRIIKEKRLGKANKDFLSKTSIVDGEWRIQGLDKELVVLSVYNISITQDTVTK
jgi:hypothetical protein